MNNYSDYTGYKVIEHESEHGKIRFCFSKKGYNDMTRDIELNGQWDDLFHIYLAYCTDFELI